MNFEKTDFAGIYLHIPFCIRKCPYCDFYSIADLSLIPSFVTSLLSEIKIRARESHQFDTLYLGGGTPSVLECDLIHKILNEIHRSFSVQKDSEITIEVNPGSVNFHELNTFHKIGINRISIGVQSFQDRHLSFLGRIHSASQATMTIASARKAGFDNLGIDLIYGLPGQSEKAWLSDLKHALEFEPEHLSCYMLTFESGTPMERDLSKGRLKPLSDKESANLFDVTLSFLNDRGYMQYEVSNFARSEKYVSRHNQKYWSSSPYIGLGPSAHSHENIKRKWNHRSVNKYISVLDSGLLPIEDTEHLTKEQQMIEAIYLGLRQTRGIHVAEFDRKYNACFKEMFKQPITHLEAKCYLDISDERCCLTPKGMLFLDSITPMFVNHIE